MTQDNITGDSCKKSLSRSLLKIPLSQSFTLALLLTLATIMRYGNLWYLWYPWYSWYLWFCLSSLGFLLSERTSGVSPVICLIAMRISISRLWIFQHFIKWLCAKNSLKYIQRIWNLCKQSQIWWWWETPNKRRVSPHLSKSAGLSSASNHRSKFSAAINLDCEPQNSTQVLPLNGRIRYTALHCTCIKFYLIFL